MASRVQGPITVAIIDDYDVVVMGVANMLDQYSDRVVIAELDTNEALLDTVDIALYDSFAQPESDHDEIAVLVANPRARRVVVYTWNFHSDLIHSALQQGAHGYLSKTLPARELVTALEEVHAGKTIISEGPPRAQCRRTRLARPRRRTQRSRVGDIGPHHARQEQCPGRSADISEPEHRKVLHPHDLPQDRSRQSHSSSPMGRQPWIHPRPAPDRSLAKWSLSRLSYSHRFG